METSAVRAAVVTVSDRCAAGTSRDVSGPEIATVLREAGISVDSVTVVPDGAKPVETELHRLSATGVDAILTTGGTGVGPRDRTPEGTATVLARHLPGIAEEIRRRGALSTPAAVLSRGLAGLSDTGTLIVNLAGSPGAARTGAEVVAPLIAHVADQWKGADHS